MSEAWKTPPGVVCIVPPYPNPAVKAPLICDAIWAAPLTIPVLLGNELAKLLPSPCRKSDSIHPKEPVDVNDPLICPSKSNPLVKLPLIFEAI